MSNGEEFCVMLGENNKLKILIPRNYEGTICIRYIVPVLSRLSELILLGVVCIVVFMNVSCGRKKNI